MNWLKNGFIKTALHLLTKKRRGSTLFFTTPLLLVMVSYLSFWGYVAYQEAETSFDPPKGIETEIDEGCYREYYCWFALQNNHATI